MNEPTSGLDLKVERIRARVTATLLAKELGVTRQRISAIEGDAVVTLDTVKRYRAALGSLTYGAQTPQEVA